MIKNFERCSHDEALVYFYCDRNKAEYRDPIFILRSFIRQLSLSQSKNAIHNSIVDLYNQEQNIGFASDKINMTEAQTILLNLISTYPNTYFIVDALDECDKETRNRFIDILNFFVLESPNPVKIFISSRPDQDIVHRFGHGPNVAIRATDNHDDIVKFVNQEIRESPPHWRERIDDELKRVICESLIEKSNGM